MIDWKVSKFDIPNSQGGCFHPARDHDRGAGAWHLTHSLYDISIPMGKLQAYMFAWYLNGDTDRGDSCRDNMIKSVQYQDYVDSLPKKEPFDFNKKMQDAFSACVAKGPVIEE